MAVTAGKVTDVGFVTVIFPLSVAYIPILSLPACLKEIPFSRATTELEPLA